MSKEIVENNLWEALTRNSLYTFTFDVSANLVEETIVSRSGVNFTEILGLEIPCSFDDMLERAFGEALQCRYTSESAVTNISRQTLLDAYEKGKTKLEANIYYAAWNKYVRITYLLFRKPENSHVLAYVICDDVTRLEEMRGDSLNLDNTNLKRERDDLTRRNSDLTEERNSLTKDNDNLTEQRNVLSEENGELIRAAASVLRRADGYPVTGYGLVMDIDEQKKAADIIDEALTQDRLANAAKTSFLARMSHDIRTPMNGILGIIEINQAHAEDTEFTSRNRAKAKVAANYLLSLINDILQLSKLDDPEVTLSYEAFNVREMAEDILTIIKMRAVDYGITVEYNQGLDAFAYPYIWGSPLHLRQIFINIFSNSIKYNKKGGKISCKVSVLKSTAEQVIYQIVIADTGIGMSIVNKMEGTIEVQSEKGKGSTFTVTIPFEIAGETDIRSEKRALEQCNIAGDRILLVEDNELNMEIAETVLQDAGAVVTKAFNGQQAVYAFAQAPAGTFDIILMDVMMPVMDGYEATRKIRSLNRLDAKTIPIIAMTANAFVEDVEESRNAGMNEHISKPLDIEKVKATIARYIGHKKM